MLASAAMEFLPGGHLRPRRAWCSTHPCTRSRATRRELGIPAGHVNRVVVADRPAGAWSRLERGEVADGGVRARLRARVQRGRPRDLGHGDDGAHRGVSGPRPAMLARDPRAPPARARASAALTNNWASPREERSANDVLRGEFDVFVESSVVGMRKPDPRIYPHACEALARRAERGGLPRRHRPQPQGRPRARHDHDQGRGAGPALAELAQPPRVAGRGAAELIRTSVARPLPVSPAGALAGTLARRPTGR